YYDGLGRPKQSISRQAGGDKQDILVPIIYDEFGRQVNEYLPYLRKPSSLEYDSGLVADVDGTILSLNEFYQNKYPNDFAGLSVEQVNPYSEKVFEASPLNRILEQAAPGKDWAVGNGHTIKFDYKANGENEVKYFSVSHPNDDTEQTELVFEGYYEANELYKTITKDENWTLGKAHTTEEFKDKQGRVILKRTYNSSSLKSKHDTYYVYDNFGNLTYVLPPEASKQILTEGAQGYRVTSQTNYPWVDMVNVDKEFAEDYNRQLKAYENEAILNADITNAYGGQGGFTVTTLETSDLVTLSITFSATQDLELKTGEIMSLKDLGTFKDTELGRLEGVGYTYLFLIRNDAIVIEGSGKLSAINQTFYSNIKLDYSENYP